MIEDRLLVSAQLSLSPHLITLWTAIEQYRAWYDSISWTEGGDWYLKGCPESISRSPSGDFAARNTYKHPNFPFLASSGIFRWGSLPTSRHQNLPSRREVSEKHDYSRSGSLRGAKLKISRTRNCLWVYFAQFPRFSAFFVFFRSKASKTYKSMI